MYERLGFLWPSIIVVLCVSLSSLAYIRYYCRKHKAELNDTLWIKDNMAKIIIHLSLPAIYIWAPFAEELMFRMPLIIIFGTLSGPAWCGIILSAAIFAASHLNNSFSASSDLEKVIKKAENDELPDSNFASATLCVKEDKSEGEKKEEKTAKIISIFLLFAFGILEGYWAIKYQSIWPAIGAHFAYNLLMPVVSALVGLIIGGILLVVLLIDEMIKTKRLKRSLKRLSRRSLCFRE